MITGANGSVGCDLVELFSKNFNVFAFYRTPNSFSRNFKHPNVSWIKQDLRTQINLAIKPRYIIHGAVTHPFAKNSGYVEYLGSNIEALKSVIEFGKEKKIEKFFYLSSIKIYGRISSAILRDSDIFVEPDLLGATKILSEKILLTQSFDVFNLRLTGVLSYRNGMVDRPWLNLVINKLLRNEDVEVFNSSRLFNNIIDTKEIFRFIVHIINENVRGQSAFNFAAQEPINIKEMVESIKISLDSKSRIDYRREERQHFTVALDKLNKYLFFYTKPTIHLIDHYIGHLINGNRNSYID